MIVAAILFDILSGGHGVTALLPSYFIDLPSQVEVAVGRPQRGQTTQPGVRPKVAAPGTVAQSMLRP